MELAIGFSIWNRKHHAESAAKMIAEAVILSGVKCSIYIHADGPRDLVEEVTCLEVRRAVCEIFDNYDLNYEIVSQNSNLGLRKSIIRLGDLVFSNSEFCLFIEDDVLITKETLEFIVDRGRRYRESRVIWSISTHNPCQSALLSRDLISPRFNSWGWATWKDRWEEVIFDEKVIREYLESEPLLYGCITLGKDWIQVAFDRLRNVNDSWAIYFQITSYRKNGKHLISGRALSSNFGFDDSGVHCQADEKRNVFSISSKVGSSKVSPRAIGFLRNLCVLFKSNSLPNRWTHGEFKRLMKSIN